MNTLIPPLAFGGGGFWDILIILAVFAPIILFIAAIVDLLAGSSKDSPSKIVWGLVILLIPVLGPIAYFVVSRRRL